MSCITAKREKDKFSNKLIKLLKTFFYKPKPLKKCNKANKVHIFKTL